MVNISPVALEVLDKLEDELKEAMMRRDNGVNLEEGILEFGNIFFKHFSPRPFPCMYRRIGLFQLLEVNVLESLARANI